MLKGRHLIDPQDFTVEELNQIFELAKKLLKTQKHILIYVREVIRYTIL